MFLRPALPKHSDYLPDQVKDAVRQSIIQVISFEQVVKLILTRFDCDSLIIIFAASERFYDHFSRERV